jgi:PTH1 family peptidyl-tRNA hydrolase
MPSDHSSMGLWVITGLGNPGRQHALSRHNVGFRCVDLLASRHQVVLDDHRRHAELGQGAIGRCPVVLARPRTYMNASGVALKYLAQRFGTRPDMLLVIIDDMDLPLGKLRLRAAGSSGGHHGLDSIICELGSQAFPRLRIGIGRPTGEAVQHVLGPFSLADEELLAEALNRAATAVEVCVTDGVESAMNRFN